MASAVADAEIDVRDPNRTLFDGSPGRSDAAGRVELCAGSRSSTSTVVDIIAAKRSPGRDGGDPGCRVGGRERPANWRSGSSRSLSLSGRVLDEDGKPIAGPIVHLYRDVIYPGQSGRSFGLPVENLNEIKNDGTYTFDHLIPGATYNTQVEVSGYPNATSDHVTVKPGPPVRLDDFRLPVADQEVSGVVVDARGKPLAGRHGELERKRSRRPRSTPRRGGVWFQDTDGAGRFHLTRCRAGRSS